MEDAPLAQSFCTIVLATATDLSLPASFNRHMAGMGAMMSGNNMMGNTGVMSDLFSGYRNGVTEALSLAAGAALAAALLASFLISRQVVGPVQKMMLISHRVAEGEYGERLAVSGNLQTGQLDELLQGVETARAVVEAARRCEITTLACFMGADAVEGVRLLGSRLLAISTPSYNGQIRARDLVETALRSHRYGQAESLHFHGIGDHGGGPARRLTDDFFAKKDLGWGPSGIVYASDATEHGRLNLFRIDPATGLTPYASGIPLIANQKYFITAVHHEGGGGDYVCVNAKVNATDPDPADGSASILNGNLIGFYAAKCSYVAFTQEPQDVTAASYASATFTAGGTTDSTTPVGPNTDPRAYTTNFLFYQWYMNGTAIANAADKPLADAAGRLSGGATEI